jgi:hypothetical protein
MRRYETDYKKLRWKIWYTEIHLQATRLVFSSLYIKSWTLLILIAGTNEILILNTGHVLGV